MKFIHTSDWHLGHVLYNYDRSEEQIDMLEQIARIVHDEQPDALLVSGDVFHNAAPSAATQKLFVDSLLHIHRQCERMRIVVTAGNHDSAARLQANARLWQLAEVNIVSHTMRDGDGMPDLDQHIIEIPGCGWVVAVPHTYASNFPAPPEVERSKRASHFFQALLDRVAQRNSAGLPVVLMAHLAVTGGDFTGHDSVGTMETSPIETLGHGYDYAALGHIHRPQTLDAEGRVRYCGTPLPVSFDEQCAHGVNIVTLNGHDRPTVDMLPISNLHPLHTIPASNPVLLEEGLRLLAEDRKTDEPAYIRLNISVDTYAPGDARERAVAALKDKPSRFCTIKVTSNNANAATAPQISVEQLRELTPLDVAEKHYNNKYAASMPDHWKDMLREAIQRTEN